MEIALKTETRSARSVFGYRSSTFESQYSRPLTLPLLSHVFPHVGSALLRVAIPISSVSHSVNCVSRLVSHSVSHSVNCVSHNPASWLVIRGPGFAEITEVLRGTY